MPSGVLRMASKGRAASWMYNEEDVDADVAAVGFGGEEMLKIVGKALSLPLNVLKAVVMVEGEDLKLYIE